MRVTLSEPVLDGGGGLLPAAARISAAQLADQPMRRCVPNCANDGLMRAIQQNSPLSSSEARDEFGAHVPRYKAMISSTERHCQARAAALNFFKDCASRASSCGVGMSDPHASLDDAEPRAPDTLHVGHHTSRRLVVRYRAEQSAFGAGELAFAAGGEAMALHHGAMVALEGALLILHILSEGVVPWGMPRRSAALPALSSEVLEADLGDVRLTHRLTLVMDSLADRASQCFPNAFDDAELEAAYRFFGNAKVTPDAILSPHFRQTVRRAGAHRDVLVIHDTTQFDHPWRTRVLAKRGTMPM